MNRYQVASDGVILDRWHAENGFECVAFPAAGWGTSMPETPAAIARQWNRAHGSMVPGGCDNGVLAGYR